MYRRITSLLIFMQVSSIVFIRCCDMKVDSATTALQNGACTYRCISKQMHYKSPLSHNGYMKSLEIYETSSLCPIW